MFEEITRHRLLQGILPVNDLCSPGELDALVGAYTAWLAATKPDQITLLGDPDEGQIVLPVPELKAHY
jgi:predicted RNase H-like nuclease